MRSVVRTNAARAAATRLSIALSTGQPICHLVTDDFTLVVRLMENAFFHRNDGSPSAEVYAPGSPSPCYRELGWFVRCNYGKDEKSPWYCKLPPEVVLYARPDGRNSFDAAMVSAMMDFAEYYRLAYRQSRYSLLSDPSGTVADTLALKNRLVLYGAFVNIPQQLERFVERVEIDPLSEEDYGLILRGLDARLTDAEIRWYADHLGGYDESMTERVARLILNSDGRATLRDLQSAEPIIINDKNMLLSSHNKLRCMSPSAGEISGLGSIAQWLKEHKHSLHAMNGSPPRGMLLVGVPGTGKSETAKRAADILELPLVKLDMSRILGGLVGDSERNMRQVLEDLTFLAPCVLWIDELEKAMSGSNGSSGDSGVMERLFGMLLTFMQEMKRNVFIVATANDISRLPPEFFRNGRFDVRFCLMMPSYRACVRIMQKKLEAYGVYDASLAQELTSICVGTADAPRFLTGADITAMVKELFVRLSEEANAPSDLSACLTHLMRERVMPRVVAYGDSTRLKNLDDIASRYCDMLQRSMLLAGDVDDSPVFAPERFHPERVTEYVFVPGQSMPSCMDPPEDYAALAPYDRWLFDRITARMNRLLARSASAEARHDLRLKEAAR